MIAMISPEPKDEGALQMPTPIEEYSEKNIQFYSNSTWALIEQIAREHACHAQGFNLCDLGCGDGSIEFALHSQGLLKRAEVVVGVDISPKRVERFEQLKEIGLRQIIGIVADACSVEQVPNESFDLIICSQLIEHVRDDKALVKETYRLLKRDGKAYISSVIRRWPGIWLYRNNAKWVLDPTHVYEYSSEHEFACLLKENGLTPFKTKVTPCAFSVLDMVIRLLIKLRLVSPVKAVKARNLFLSNSFLRLLTTKLRFPIPGFYIVEVVCSRHQSYTGVPCATT